MRKRNCVRLTAGLLCMAMFFTDMMSMEIHAVSNNIDVGKIVSSTEMDNENYKNDTDITNEEEDSEKQNSESEETASEKEKENIGEVEPGTEQEKEPENAGLPVEEEGNPGSEKETEENQTDEEQTKDEQPEEIKKPEAEETEEGSPIDDETLEQPDKDEQNPIQKDEEVDVKDEFVDKEEVTIPVEEEGGDESISENTVDEYTLLDSVSENTLDENAVMLAAAGDIASGHDGNITWVIDAKGKLIIKGSGNYSFDVTGYPFWHQYNNLIISAEVDVIGMTRTYHMFDGCYNMISADLSKLDTSQVNDMSSMFCGCSSLKELNLNNFETGKVTNMALMFLSCQDLVKLDLCSFNTSQVTNMSSMFDGCRNLTELNLSSFNTSRVTNMSGMFGDCRGLTKLDLSNFDTGNVEYMSQMFAWCTDLVDLDISNFNTNNVSDVYEMFLGCGKIVRLDISHFDFNKVTEGGEMFTWCDSLKRIDAPYNLTASINLPESTSEFPDNIVFTWYRSDGTVVTELPKNLSYSVALGKNYIPTEKTPDDSEGDESLDAREKYVQNITQYALANADDETRKTIQGALYNLLFKAYYAPEGQNAEKTVTFSGNEQFNRNWPYQNGIKAGTTVKDSGLGVTVTYAKSSAGCLSYARFASQYIYGNIANYTSVKDMSAENVKQQILAHVDPGEIIGFSNCIHFVVFLGESGDGKGFYCLSYGGGGSHKEKMYHTISVVYFTYKDFVKKYTNFNGKKADAFLYYDTNGGTYRNQSTKKKISPVKTGIKIECPGTAVVQRNGEKLDSSSSGTASFGSVAQSGSQITFDLAYSPDYQLSISGTNVGTMTVTLIYYDEAGNQINQRKFINVPITTATEIESGGFDHMGDFVLYVSDETGEMSAWGAGPGETASAPDDSFLPETSFEFDASDDETGVHYKDIPENGSIPQGLWISQIPDVVYNGAAIKPEVRVYNGEKRLKKGKDYTISYQNNTKAAQSTDEKPPTVVVQGKGNYSGKETQTFSIAKRDIADELVIKNFTDAYALPTNGKNPKLVFSVKCNKKALRKNMDYTLTVKNSNGTEVADYMMEGTYSLVVKGVGSNYMGETSLTFEVLNKIPVSKLNVGKIAAVEYDGKSKRPEPVIKYGKLMLTKGTDYSLRYRNNKDMGTATIVITGKGDYFGTRNVNFTITGQQIKKAKFTGFQNSFSYTGDTVYQSGAVLKYDEKELVMGTDYTVSYSNHLNKGRAAVTYIGIGNYTGTLKKNYSIVAYDITADIEHRISLSKDEINVVYEKGGAKPSLKVYDGTLLLTEGKDYTLSYQNNKAVAKENVEKPPTITVKGKGNYTGVFAEKKTFNILPKDFAEVEVKAPDVAAGPKAGKYKSTPVITDTNVKRLQAGTDYDKTYTYTYKNTTEKVLCDELEVTRNAGAPVEENDIIPANTVLCVSIKAKEGGNYIGEKTVEYRIVESPISRAKITVQNPSQDNKNLFPYTGQEVRIDKNNLVVKVGENVLTGDQYEILEDTYKNNVNKGTASVQIQGVGNVYGGTATVKFRIGTKGFQWFWRLFG